MRYFYIEKVDWEVPIYTPDVQEYNFYESGKGDILVRYIKYEDGINDLRHLLNLDYGEEFLIPIVEEMISECKFSKFGHSENMFQYDEFNYRHKRRIRSNKLNELGI